MRKLTDWRKYIISRLTTNREESVHFLDAVLDDFQTYRNVAALNSALEVVIETQGGMIELAKRTHMSPDAIQKILSSDNAPDIESLCTILNALGCRLSIQPLEDTNQEIKSTSEDQRTSAAG